MEEAVAELLKARGQDALAGEEQSFGHFTEDEFEGEGRRRKNRRTAHGSTEFASEVGVASGLGRNNVQRAADGAIFYCVAKHTDNVIQRNPGHPLPA